MRRPWIKIEVSTPDKPEICAIATKLRIDPDAVVGKLVRLWSWAELSGVNANELSVTKEFIDKVCGRKGFAEALIHAGWLLESDGALSFPKFDRHNGNASKVRGLTARRVEQHRVRKGKANVKNVAKKTKAKRIAPEAESISNEADPVIKEAPEASTALEETEIIHSAPVENLTSMPLAEPEEPAAIPQPPEAVSEIVESAEEKPKKRRSKAAAIDDEQPMLF